MHPSSARARAGDSGRNDTVRKKPAIVLNGVGREDQAMARIPRRHRVVSVLVDGMSPLEPAVAQEIFGIDPEIPGIRWYSHAVVSATPTVTLKGGLTTTTDGRLDGLRRADTVIIPGWSNSADPSPTASSRMSSVARIAAAAGSCRSARAHSSWPMPACSTVGEPRPTGIRRSASAIGSPRVELDPGVLYVDEGQVLTAAGSASAIDLSLHIVRSDHGAEVANTLARDLVVPPHRDGGQAQYVDAPMPTVTGVEDPFGDTLSWAVAHLDRDLPVAELAHRALMSPRHFTRRFRATTGTSPHQWMLTQRLALARRLLETTDEPIEIVAQRSGFGTAAALRLRFRKHLDTTPAAYRSTFDCTMASEAGA